MLIDESGPSPALRDRDEEKRAIKSLMQALSSSGAELLEFYVRVRAQQVCVIQELGYAQ